MSEIDKNPHKKIKTNPQIRLIFWGTQICMCISKNKTQSIIQGGAQYRKLMQYGLNLSTKHPSETNNNFENSYLKSIIVLVKYITFYNIPINI